MRPNPLSWVFNYHFLNDTINFKGDIIINETIIISENEVLIINAGSNIKFQNNSNLIVYGNIQILGSKKNPVMISNIDDSNSSIVAMETFGINNIFHTRIQDLASLKHKEWINSAALTFYESDVVIKHTNFSKNKRKKSGGNGEESQILNRKYNIKITTFLWSLRTNSN